MPTLKARPVRRSRRHWYCDSCSRPLPGPHIYLYGSADQGDKPSAFRLCQPCCADSADPKVRAALDALATN